MITSADMANYNNYKSNVREQSLLWGQIVEYKKEFLVHKKDPFSFPALNPEIAESWIRSYKKGVDPYRMSFGRKIKREDLTKIKKDNQTLIEIAQPLFLSFKDLARYSRYFLNLDDKNGVSVLQEGIDSLPQYHSQLWGKMYTEDTIGTNASFLSKKLIRPVQLLGPEHYCTVFENILATTAPILNNKGEVIAILSLCSHIADHADNVQKIMEHALSYIISLSTAIESKFKLLTYAYDKGDNTDQYYRTINDIFVATTDLIDEGFVAIDRKGNIAHVNKEGLRVLDLKPGDIQHRNITEFLSEHSNLIDIMNRGENRDFRDILYIGNNTKPCLINIQTIINRDTDIISGAILRFKNQEKSNLVINKGAPTEYYFQDIIGESTGIKNAINLGQIFAKSSENILITGESGTGKELFAQAVHNINCPDMPFIAINCAAIPKSLIESELFGYEGGSFTGAEKNGRPGKIELANGGTLFLDEIGDMPYDLQAVLLRILQDKQVMRIGGRSYKKIDFRVIAATNKDLRKMVQDNQFREDLYYRLSVLTIKIPPLRERGDDIELLSRLLVQKYCLKLGKEPIFINPLTFRQIKEFNWPGNVRELENALIYAVNIAQGETIEPKHLPEYILENNNASLNEVFTDSQYSDDVIPTWQDIEKKIIENTLMKTRYNVPQAAALLNMSKSTVYRKIKDYHIQY